MKAKQKKQIYWASAILMTLAVAFILYWIFYGSHYQDTDDAFIEGHPVPVSSRVAGYVQEVYVDDNQAVSAGEVVIALDPRDFETALAQAKADLAAAEAEYINNERNLKRYRQLRATQDVSQQTLDQALAMAESSRAKVAQTQAAVVQAELNLSYTKIFVPKDGHVTNKSVEVGAYVQVGQPMFYLVTPDIWVIANFKENQITHMKPGQPVTINIDAYPGHDFKGRVHSIQYGSGAAFSLFPPENATGNYVKVVQRVPVKIVFDQLPDPSQFVLGPGLSVEPRVKIK